MVMKTRRIIMMSALAVMVVLFMLVVLQRTGRSAGPDLHAVELKGGKSVEGILMELHAGTYLIHAEGESFIVPVSEIRRVDGEAPVKPDLPVSDRVPRLQETYEDVTADGRITLHSTHHYENRSSKIIRKIKWGLAKHEFGHLATYKVVDVFGNDLPVTLKSAKRFDGKRITVDLARPILPGETLQLTTIYEEENGVRKEDDTWIYRIDGDYPDDRLVTRSVRLPAGAEILSISPEPLHQVNSGDRPLVVWRRYFLKGERIPWVIRYKL
jgi:hypothetical protein